MKVESLEKLKSLNEDAFLLYYVMDRVGEREKAAQATLNVRGQSLQEIGSVNS